MSLSSSAFSLGADAVFDAAGQWVAAGATWILQQLVTVVSATTAPPIGTAWFTARLGVMAGIGASLAVPLTCCAAIQAVLRQSPALLVRAVVVHLPVALVCTGTAVALVQMGLSITDALSMQVLAGAGTTAGDALSPVSAAFGAASASAPSFAVLLGAVVVAVAGLTLWLEMAVRSAAVSLAVLFLPLVMAAMVWPAVGHWCRRLVETLTALVLSKLVVVGALALAASALGDGLGGAGGDGFGAVVTGAALLLVAATCPFALLRLIPAVEAGAVAQLEQARHHLRHAAGAPRRAAAGAVSWARVVQMGAGDLSGLGPVGPVGPGGDGGVGGGPGGPGPGPGGGRPGGGRPGGGRPGGGGSGGGGSGGGPPGPGPGAGPSTGAVTAVTSATGRPSGADPTAGSAGRASPRDGSGLGTMATDQEVAATAEAVMAGVPRPFLDVAVRRRLSGMDPAEAHAPFMADGAGGADRAQAAGTAAGAVDEHGVRHGGSHRPGGRGGPG